MARSYKVRAMFETYRKYGLDLLLESEMMINLAIVAIHVYD